MHIITQRRFREFAAIHPEADEPLRKWLSTAKKATWSNFAAMRADFPHADQVGRSTVFNIGGNKFRLIVRILYHRSKVFVVAVLTHAEYDRGGWKNNEDGSQSWQRCPNR